MPREIVEDQVFEKKDFTIHPLPKGEYEFCSFLNCNFSDSDLKGISFSGCEFNACNLTLAKTLGTAFKEVKFRDCKLVGIHFEICSPLLFEVNFENCILDFSSFFKLKIKKTRFLNCSLKEVDFVEADLMGSSFDGSDLTHAKFEKTNLENADFRCAFGFQINPAGNSIKKAKFSLAGLEGLLSTFGIEISP